MNLRDIKKDIEYCVGAYIDDCTLFLTLNPGKGGDAILDLIDESIDLFNELRNKVGTPEGSKKVYYNGIRKEMLEKLDALYEKLSEAVKVSIQA